MKKKLRLESGGQKLADKKKRALGRGAQRMLEEKLKS
jgi:hypothetical protein